MRRPTSRPVSAVWFMPNCQRFRVRAGIGVSELAAAAKVSRDFVRRVEKGMPAKQELLHRIAKVFEETSKDQFDRDKEITSAQKRTR